MLSRDCIKIDDNRTQPSALVKACKLQNDRLYVRLPLQKNLLRMILDQIWKFYSHRGQIYLAKLYHAIVSTGYCGLLRVGELTTGTHPIRAANVFTARTKLKYQLILHSSKTHSCSDLPQKVTLISNPQIKRHCPFKMLHNFIQARPKRADNEEPLFIFRDRAPVKPYHLRLILKKAIKAIGLDESLYVIDSLRIGRCTDLMYLNVPMEKIKFFGRWRSNAVYKYVR